MYDTVDEKLQNVTSENLDVPRLSFDREREIDQRQGRDHGTEGLSPLDAAKFLHLDRALSEHTTMVQYAQQAD